MMFSLFRWFRSRRSTVVDRAAGRTETTGVLTQDQIQMKDVRDPNSDRPADGRDISDEIPHALELENTIEYSTRPESPMAHYNLARKLCANEDFDGAIKHCLLALQSEPGYARAHCDLGVIFSERGDHERALLHFRKAVEADPENAIARKNVMVALYNSKDYEGTIAHCRGVLMSAPDDAEALCFLGAALMQKGLGVEALPSLRRGDELGSKRPGWTLPSADWVKQCELAVK
jgi:tetratricopeptide (TPR) repeat protein